ncbi:MULTISPECIES: low molecular weight phosphatase family protein [Labrys]|uniref:arsenate-mycothiol transferase ArsC n=1 Tax=Labrys TaxID=204476 RepID=UPI00083449F5|nr:MULTISPECIES: low molecular weight phosphatase family protein [unclassified Labrys (in: a-proteobacteria)]MDZ5449527.1 low molecular weight phosphatase family protein [Labrys sp. ZIDIC5]OCC04814.1 ArsC family transcriptional regulator [Labrys sp. WJW]
MKEGRRPQSVLFACAHNVVRSPMAEAIGRYYFGRSIFFGSAGVRPGEPDPFVAAALDEIGISLGKHRPQSFEDLEELEGLNFDLIITLAPQAHHKALDLTRTLAADVEYWPTPDPSIASGNREQKLDAYRALRESLIDKITERLG